MEAGYLDDPFARALGVGLEGAGDEGGSVGRVVRRLPLMNRGESCHYSSSHQSTIRYRH